MICEVQKLDKMKKFYKNSNCQIIEDLHKGISINIFVVAPFKFGKNQKQS